MRRGDLRRVRCGVGARVVGVAGAVMVIAVVVAVAMARALVAMRVVFSVGDPGAAVRTPGAADGDQDPKEQRT